MDSPCAADPSEAEDCLTPDQLRELKENRRLCRSKSWERALQTPLPTTPRLLRAHSGPTAVFQDTNIVALLISRSPLDVVSQIAMTCTGWALFVAELYPDRTENTCLVLGDSSSPGKAALIETYTAGNLSLPCHCSPDSHTAPLALILLLCLCLFLMICGVCCRWRHDSADECRFDVDQDGGRV